MGGSKRKGENSSCNYISNSLTNIDKKPKISLNYDPM